jgi:hypothetical protein
MVEGLKCGKCGASLSESPWQLPRTVCSQCGSTSRHFDRTVDEAIPKPRMSSRMRIKRADRSTMSIEIISGEDLHRHSGRWNDKLRVIDRENNQYKEKITDPDTGRTIHDVEEPLTKHRDHGSAKKLKAPKSSA